MHTYTHPAIDALWSEPRRFQLWTSIEQAVSRAQARQGLIPDDAARAIGAALPPSASEVAAVEVRTLHDVAAFVEVLESHVATPHGRWVHHGLTSSDVVDTALALVCADTDAVIQASAQALEAQLVNLATEHDRTYTWGRTHGQRAEPTTIGHQLDILNGQLAVAQRQYRLAPVPMKMSGPVGTYAYNDEVIEHAVAVELHLPISAAAGQCVPRHYHADWAWALMRYITTCEAIALWVRLNAQEEIGVVREGFGTGQVGSSSMPHKRNPIGSERITGLARVARGHFLAIQETPGALWNERDISNSAVERTALASLATLTGWMLEETTSILADLHVGQGQHDWADSLPTSAAKLYYAVISGISRKYAHDEISRTGAVDRHMPDLEQAEDPAWYVRNL